MAPTGPDWLTSLTSITAVISKGSHCSSPSPAKVSFQHTGLSDPVKTLVKSCLLCSKPCWLPHCTERSLTYKALHDLLTLPFSCPFSGQLHWLLRHSLKRQVAPAPGPFHFPLHFPTRLLPSPPLGLHSKVTFLVRPQLTTLLEL